MGIKLCSYNLQYVQPWTPKKLIFSFPKHKLVLSYQKFTFLLRKYNLQTIGNPFHIKLQLQSMVKQKHYYTAMACAHTACLLLLLEEEEEEEEEAAGATANNEEEEMSSDFMQWCFAFSAQRMNSKVSIFTSHQLRILEMVLQVIWYKAYSQQKCGLLCMWTIRGGVGLGVATAHAALRLTVVG